MKTRASLVALAIIAGGIASAPAFAAQPQAARSGAYPTKPIRFIIPFPPGDSLDIMSRLIAPAFVERLGQNLIVDNRPGAAGQLGLTLGAHAPPDGYTVVAGQGGNMSVQPHTYKKLPYDPLKDFTPVAVSTMNYLVIVTSPNAPFKTVQELINHAKTNKGALKFASNGEGGFPHMTMEMLRVAAGLFDYTHIPYKGSGEIMNDVMASRVDITILGVGSVTPFIKAGRVRLLAVTSPKRQELWPDTPAVAETLPGYDSRGWFGYVAPAGTPKHIVAILNREINRAMSAPDVKEKLNNIGLTVVTESPEWCAQFLKEDYEKYGKVIKAINFKPQ